MKKYQVIVTKIDFPTGDQNHYYEYFLTLKEAENYAKKTDGDYPNVVEEYQTDQWGEHDYSIEPKELSRWWRGKKE